MLGQERLREVRVGTVCRAEAPSVCGAVFELLELIWGQTRGLERC